MPYRPVSWKRNLRVVPKAILTKVKAMPRGIAVAPVSIKRVALDELKSGMYRHLKMNVTGNDPGFPEAVVPPEDMGIYSSKNVNGWEIKRTDLPMVWKEIYLGDRPIYGDWSNGSFPLWQEREVYQVEEFAPTDYSIKIELLRKIETSFVFRFALDCVLDPTDSSFLDDLLFCLNVLQENTGVCDVERADRSREDYVSTTLVEWEIFPPGSVERFLAKAKFGMTASNDKVAHVIEERVEQFRRLSPRQYILGKGGFNRYIGAVMPNDVVVFENIRYGNALYVLYENWEEVSKRSRSTLLRGTSGEYERIPHVEGWGERLTKAVRQKPSTTRRR